MERYFSQYTIKLLLLPKFHNLDFIGTELIVEQFCYVKTSNLDWDAQMLNLRNRNDA